MKKNDCIGWGNYTKDERTVWKEDTTLNNNWKAMHIPRDTFITQQRRLPAREIIPYSSTQNPKHSCLLFIYICVFYEDNTMKNIMISFKIIKYKRM